MQEPSCRTKLALLLMLKNESDRVSATINSVAGCIDHIIIYDTGSTDGTVDVCRQVCAEAAIRIHVFEGKFVDFCTSRNAALELAETVQGITHVLFADSNDEIIGGDLLSRFIEETNYDAYMVRQEWVYGTDSRSDVYYNYKVFRLGSGIKYRGRVHEWPHLLPGSTSSTCSECTLFQDRKYDAHKSASRFAWDYDILKQNIDLDPGDSRSMFYLAQTCACLSRPREAIEYYIKRYYMDGGFWEEKFHCCMRIYEMQDDKDDLMWVYRALDVCLRVEPVIHIIKKLDRSKRYSEAYSWALLATRLPYPSEYVLYVDTVSYEYTRYHWMSRVAFYAAFENRHAREECMLEGLQACRTACASKYSSECDRTNISFYTSS